MFTASSAPVTSRCRPRWSTIFCFCGPLRRSPRVFLRLFGPCFPGLSAVLLGPRGVRSSFGASRSSCVPSGPAGPSSSSRRLVAPRAPRLSLRTCRLTPARCSALPRAPPAALLCFVRGLLRPALRRLACSSRRCAARRPLSSCLVFSPARRRRRRRTLALRPGPFAAVPAVRSPPSSLPFQPPLAAFFLAFVSPAFFFALPVAFGDLFFAFAFVLPSLIGPFLWLFLGYFFLFIVYGTSIAR